MWRGFMLVLAGVGSARADDALSARTHVDRDMPVLQLDPALSPVLQGLRAETDVDRAAIDLSPRVSVERVITGWRDADTDALGWRWQGRLTYRLGGGLLLDATLGGGAVQSRYGSNEYIDAGLALTKLFRLSRWTTAWLSLSASYGGPSLGGTVMLRLGFTFR